MAGVTPSGLERSWPAEDLEPTGELISRCAQDRVTLADIARLAQVDPSLLDGEARVELIQAFERAKSRLDGAQQVALAAVVDATEALGLGGQDARHEVGAALRLAPVTAADRTRVAADLGDRLPETLLALRRGDIYYSQAANLARGVADLSPEMAGAVEARVLPKMSSQTAAETRRAVQAAVVAVDPDGTAERHKKAVKERKIERLPQPDGMASWWVPLPADLEHDMWTQLSAEAAKEKAIRRAAGIEDPGIDALRVDAVIDAILGAGAAAARMSDPDPADAADGTDGAEGTEAADEDGADQAASQDGPDPAGGVVDEEAAFAAVLTILQAGAAGSDGSGGKHVPRCSCGGRQVAAIVVDLPTALGLADNPGHLPGYGAVPGPLARRMAADRDWIRWTVDPGTGQLLDRGAETYRPSARMLAYIAARDQVCGFPGCNQPAQVCDCDHIVIFGSGGKTVAVNLGPLCRQHHNAKTHGRWRLYYDPETRSKIWVSPLGLTYLKASIPLLT